MFIFHKILILGGNGWIDKRHFHLLFFQIQLMDYKEYYLQVKKKKNLSKNFSLKRKNNGTVKKSLLTVHTARCNLHEKGCNLTNPYTNTAFLFVLPKNYDNCS